VREGFAEGRGDQVIAKLNDLFDLSQR